MQGKSELQLLALCWQDHWELWDRRLRLAHSSYRICIESVLCSGAGCLAPNRQLAFSPHLSSSSGTEVRPGVWSAKVLIVSYVYSNREWTLDRYSQHWLVVACRYILFCQYI